VSDLNEIRKKVRNLVVAEADKMRAKGASDADVREDAFIEMVSRKVADETFDDLGADERKDLWRNFLETASPEQLRHMAKNLRAKGEVNAPYSLEHLADLREREGGE
jgi:hypothetical protein